MTTPTTIRIERRTLDQITAASWKRQMNRSAYIRMCLRVGYLTLEQKQERTR